VNELHVVLIVSQVPEFVCKQLRKTVIFMEIRDIDFRFKIKKIVHVFIL